MAVPPERRSKTRQPLHNFILPPNGLKWGNQKFLRCIKIDPNQDDPPIPGRKCSVGLPSSSSSSLVNSGEQKQEKMERKGKEIEDECVRPWNLRTWRAACKEPKRDLGLVVSSGKRRRGGMVVVEERRKEESEENKRVKFCVRLCKEEIESDLVAITGNKPHRRPKKRPKALQRQLDALLPGMWLSEITPDSYKVPDNPEPGKVRAQMRE